MFFSGHLRLLWYECGHVLILQASLNKASSCVSVPCASILSVCRTILTRCTTSPGTPQDCFFIQLSRRHPGMAFLLLVPLLLMFSKCSSQSNRQLACHGCCLYRPHSQAEHMPPKPHMAGGVQGDIVSTALKMCVDNWCWVCAVWYYACQGRRACGCLVYDMARKVVCTS